MIARRRAGAAVAAGVAPRSRRPRRDAAVLAASPSARGRRRRAARADLRQRLRRADRLSRRRRAASGSAGSPTPSSSTIARSRPAPTTPSCARSAPELRARAAADPALARLRARGDRAAGRRAPPVLGCGAELKSTFCLAKGDRAWVGHHIGDLKNYETLTLLPRGDRRTSSACSRSSRSSSPTTCTPTTSRPATRSSASELEPVAVQHHHAHLAAVPRRARRDRARRSGAIFDGAGLGPDGTVWGGEILVGDLAGYERAGFLLPGAASGRRRGGPRAVADGLRLARAALETAEARRSRRRLARRGGRAATGRRSASWSRPASARR